MVGHPKRATLLLELRRRRSVPPRQQEIFFWLVAGDYGEGLKSATIVVVLLARFDGQPE
jgi:hypothetical protein